MEISFIIPVYNGENCIKNCLRSIQEWDASVESEIIIVDDGSVDNTAKICDEEAKNDKRIKVFHLENKGSGEARNYGIWHASGNYIYFVDADDSIITENVYKLLTKAYDTNADIIMGSYYKVQGNKQMLISFRNEGYIRKDGNKYEVERYNRMKVESGSGYVWNKLYRLKFLKDNNINMGSIKSANMEDLIFNIKALSCKPKYYYMDMPVYRHNVSELHTHADADLYIKSVGMNKVIIKHLKDKGVLEENADLMVSVIARTFCHSMMKNVHAQGKSFKSMLNCANAFASCKEIQEVLHIPNAISGINGLPSDSQNIIYKFVLVTLKNNLTVDLSLWFYMLYPIIRKILKSSNNIKKTKQTD